MKRSTIAMMLMAATGVCLPSRGEEFVPVGRKAKTPEEQALKIAKAQERRDRRAAKRKRGGT